MANPIKIAQYESIIQRVISRAIVEEVENKYAKFATITSVKLSRDLGVAIVYIDCIDRSQINNTLDGLSRVKGFLRSKVARALNVYKTPELRFVNDVSIDEAMKIERLLESIKTNKN